MRIFIDSANLEDIKSALEHGFPRGITTNPSLLAKEPKGNYIEHVKKIINLIKENGYDPKEFSLSVEVFSEDPTEMIKQTHQFVEEFNYPALAIKIQAGMDSLKVIRQLAKEGIVVNATCNMTINQAIMAAAAGARYVSLFWGRIRESSAEKHTEQYKSFIEQGIIDEKDKEPFYIVQATRKILGESYPKAEIIVGSIRLASDVKNAGVSGAHIVTVPPKLFPQMISHYKTDEVINQFMTDFKNWIS